MINLGRLAGSAEARSGWFAQRALEDGDTTLRLFAATHAPAGVDARVAWATLLELARGGYQAQLRAQALRALVRRSEPRPKLREALRAIRATSCAVLRMKS